MKYIIFFYDYSRVELTRTKKEHPVFVPYMLLVEDNFDKAVKNGMDIPVYNPSTNQGASPSTFVLLQTPWPSMPLTSPQQSSILLTDPRQCKSEAQTQGIVTLQHAGPIWR